MTTLSNLTLRHLVEELSYLENGFVNKLQTLENGWIKIKVHTKQGDKNLIITPNYFFVSNTPLKANQNPGGFSAFLKKHLFNQRIVAMKQKGFDRIVLLEFPEKILVLELFAKGNIILCDKEMTILKAMRREEWKDRKLETGEKYLFPTSRGGDPLEENEKEFLAKMKENHKTSFGAMIDISNVAPEMLEFAFDATNIDKKKDAADLTEKEGLLLLREIKKIYSSKANNIYVKNGAIYSYGREKEFESINDALNTLSDTPKVVIEKKQKKKIDYDLQTEGLKKDEVELKQKGEYIYLQYNKIQEILKAIELGRKKGLKEKEIAERINGVQKVIKKLEFKSNKVTLDI